MKLMDIPTVIFILVGVTLAAQPKIGRGYSGVMIYIPALVGAILVNTLPSHNRIGLLFSYWTSSMWQLPFSIKLRCSLQIVCTIVPFVNGLAWVSVVTAGHTKRMLFHWGVQDSDLISPCHRYYHKRYRIYWLCDWQCREPFHVEAGICMYSLSLNNSAFIQQTI
jgi:hypothetical protein